MTTEISPIVRPSTSEDMTAITEIYAASVLTGLGTFEIDPPDEMEMTARRNAVLQQQLPYIVVEVDGEVVGFAYAGLYRPRPAYRNTVENSVYIREDMRGRGVGKALLDELIKKGALRNLGRLHRVTIRPVVIARNRRLRTCLDR